MQTLTSNPACSVSALTSLSCRTPGGTFGNAHDTYIGSLYNASVVVYDPYKASIVSTIEFPNITRTPPFHIGGVAWDPYFRGRDNTSADEITILVDAAAAQ
ncbi:hypothetical protein NPX13_g9291 [Xylaria arbuscula]|uniref:Uncharacterized protein n=1 Tax=Xylaria arbuscula TaxID=114810 RepID=A0A9W8THU7_9PEZI|nr:hypothetical protein NPX13_g9291 [Xylaria arbuscula]